jgi:hypothetical protein
MMRIDAQGNFLGIDEISVGRCDEMLSGFARWVMAASYTSDELLVLSAVESGWPV